jgi:hypothetical protein
MATPLPGLYGFGNNTPVGVTGRDPTEWGRPSDPAHAVWGDASGQYPAGRKEAHPYPVFIDEDELGDVAEGAPSGIIHDHTPRSHAAPTFAGIEHDPVERAEGSRRLHGQDLGGSSLKDWHLPYPEHPNFVLNISEGSSALARPPGQLARGTDVDQGKGGLNQYGFSSWHQFRPWWSDPVPRNYGSTGERPFFGKHPVGTTRYDVDSTYGPQGDTSQGMNIRPVDTAYPTPYVQPPNPTVSPETLGDIESPFAWG